MKMTPIVLIIIAIAGVAGAAVSAVMFVSAVTYSEWGRVVLYALTAVACTELTVISVNKLRKR